MASQFLPGALNPGAHERPMTIMYKGHVLAVSPQAILQLLVSHRALL